jgi:hypothetical protein
MAMRVYLDDCRPTPPGWVRTFTPHETIDLLQAGKVTELSLDHDLGGDDTIGTGYDVVLWIEEQVALHGFQPPRMAVHSANPCGRQRMEQGIQAIERLVARRTPGA